MVNRVESRVSKMDLEAIVQYVNTVGDIFGRKWLARKKRQIENRTQPKTLQEFAPLYQPPIHPVVEWAIEYEEKWWPELLRTKIPPLSQDVIKLFNLGEALECTRSQKGFDRLIHRLKQIDEFDAAAFEVEVAASYVARGYGVEFIEESIDRTPDLKVTTHNEKDFWVECKRRDPGTERDKKIESIWAQLEISLLSYIKPRQLNYLIFVKAQIDPEWEDVAVLKELVLDLVKAREKEGISKGTILDPSEKFEILVEKLSDPDEEFEIDNMGLFTTEKLDQGVFGCEWMINEKGKSFARNPIFIGFKTVTPPDWISGVVNLIDAARGQLPESGAGVVWIRIPDVSWKEGVIEPLERIEELVKEKLTGNDNRRMNSVFVMKRVFEQGETDGIPQLMYHPLIIRIDHNNPKVTIEDFNT